MTVQEQVKAEEALSSKLSEFVGEWVAVKEHKVAAHAKTLKALISKVDIDTVEGVFRVPQEKNAVCLF